jgi:retron-type reverse transcriptase
MLASWRVFRRGKRKKVDVADFELRLEENIFALHEELLTNRYVHGPYKEFVVCDPKRRTIHKACVRDRVVQQALYQVLSPLFDPHFIYDSFSSRIDKGTHLGVVRLERAMRKITVNWKRPAYALKCDIRRFFDSINHQVLKEIIGRKILDQPSKALVESILESFEKTSGKGLPLGNVTSQLFANVYMNEFDQYVKHILKQKYYFRYCDDFVILARTKEELEILLAEIATFLQERLLLELHPHKVEIRKIRQGIDFLGYVVFPHHRRLRTKTRRRVYRRIAREVASTEEKLSQLSSYQGVAKYARERMLQEKIQTQKSRLG